MKNHEIKCILLIIIAIPFLLFPSWWTPIGLLLIALSWLIRWQAKGYWSFSTYIDGPVLVLAFMMGIGLLVSIDHALSLNRASVMLLGISLFYSVANHVHTEKQILKMGIALIVVGIGTAFVSLVGTDWRAGALMEFSGLSWFYSRLPTLVRGVPGSGMPSHGELFNPRMVAGTMAFLLPIPASFLIWFRGWKLTLLSAFTVLIMTSTLVLTQSPQGILGVSIALLMLGVIKYRGFLLVLPLAFFGGLWVFSTLPLALLDRLWLGISTRIPVWYSSLYMIRDMPFTGIGLNTFPIVDDKFYNLIPRHIPHAHNTFLQMAVDLGIPGLIAFLAMLWGFATTVVRAYKSSSNPNIRTLLLGIAGGVAAWLGYGLADALVLGHKAAMAIWVMFGLVAAVARINGVPARSRSYPKAVWGLFGLIGLTILLMMPILGSAFALNVSTFLMHRAWSHEQPPPELAIGLAQQAVTWYDGNSRAYYLLGLAANQREESEEAVKNWEMTIKLNPSDYLAHYHLGWAYYEQGDLEKAMEQWRISQAAKQVLREAKSQYDAKQWDAAEELYQAAIELDPEQATAWYGLGASYIHQQRWNEAIETFRISIEKFPQRVTGYGRLSALLYERQHNAQEAIAIAELGLKKVEDQKSKAWLYERLARTYWGEGEPTPAYQMATLGTAANPDCAGCWGILGDIQLNQKKYSQALEAYQQAALTESSYWQWAGHSRMANVYVARNELELAMQELEEAIRRASALQAREIDISKLYTSLAQLLVQGGRLKEGQEAYQKALQLDSTNERAREQLQNIP